MPLSQSFITEEAAAALQSNVQLSAFLLKDIFQLEKVESDKTLYLFLSSSLDWNSDPKQKALEFYLEFVLIL